MLHIPWRPHWAFESLPIAPLPRYAIDDLLAQLHIGGIHSNKAQKHFAASSLVRSEGVHEYVPLDLRRKEGNFRTRRRATVG